MMMDNSDTRQDEVLSKRVLQALNEAIVKLETVERARTEPVAIIGMGCRFPGGATDPDSFWNLLKNGQDAITEVPLNRWDINAYYDPDPDKSGKMYTRYGGFLESLDEFDPHFFGISPKEAISLDPQQRLLMEVSWEALERAGQAKEKLTGSQTGVFIGITANDYGQLIMKGNDNSQMNAYFSTGNTLNSTAGRLSYILGLQGPSMAVDTACSSSLVAVHLACQSLRLRECDMAVAGGVNVILLPEVTISLCRAKMLSPDGRCKTFDKGANGYVRSEGCGVVVLKRLSDALADRDPVVALIRGSAVNQDGASSGFTVPNGVAQERLIRQALHNARLEPSDITYVEAHGTGTPLGDPIEVRALATTFGQGRTPDDNPLLLGSVKTNIGHLESASAIAGLIKVALALDHGELPPHLHFKEPNPHIPWDTLPVKVLTENTPWPQGKAPRMAGVSSFGASGTNAHVILQETPGAAQTMNQKAQKEESHFHLLTLSAKTPEALNQSAYRYKAYIADNPSLNIHDLCHTTHTGRSHFAHRVSIVAATTVEMEEKISAFIQEEEGREMEGVFYGKALQRPKMAFFFPGQISQYKSMGRQLYDTQPVFRENFDRCSEILASYKVMVIDGTTYTQPGLFALEYGLTQLWKSWGIEPTVVIGYGVGEYVAACVAGVLSVEDSLKLIAHRANLQAQTTHFLKAAQEVIYSIPKTGFIANMTGHLAKEEVASFQYWVNHEQGPVKCAEGIKSLQQEGYEVFVEIGHETSLAAKGRQRIEGDGLDLPSMLSTFKQSQHEVRQMLQCLATLYVHGATVDWQGFHCHCQKRPVVLPTYPWQRQRYWIYENEAKTDWLYKVQWRPQLSQARPFLSTSSIPASEAIYNDLCPMIDALRDRDDLRAYEKALNDLDALSVDYVVEAFQRMGWTFHSEQRFSKETLAERCGVISQHWRLLDRLLQMLAEVGVLRQTGDRWEVIRTPVKKNVSDQIHTLSLQCPEVRAELGLLELCGSELANVLKGHQDPLTLLFPEGNLTPSTRLYQDSPGARVLNSLVQRAVESALKDVREGHIRILEIGAGTGATTACILPNLPESRTEYVFSDISRRFTTQAQQKFKDYPFVHYHILDIEQSPLKQGVAQHQQDIVLAVNVLHATRDLHESLANVLQLLKPGGMLILVEATTPLQWVDLVFGLTEGWWRFTDTHVRPSHPLLSATKWEHLLKESGFEQVVTTDGFDKRADILSKQAVIIARAPKRQIGLKPKKAWIVLADRQGVGQKLKSHIDSSGDLCVLGFLGDSSGGSVKQQAFYLKESANPEDFQQLLDGIKPYELAGVVHLWSLDSAKTEAMSLNQLQVDTKTICSSALYLVQSLARRVGRSELPPPPGGLWLVTQGAVSTNGSSVLSGLAQSPLWGMGKIIGLEHPELKPVQVDLDPEYTSDKAAQVLWEELLSGKQESQVAFQDHVRHVARLVRYKPATRTFESVAIESSGSYLITGGLGGLGLLVAQWLIQRGARHVILVGRNEPSPIAETQLQKLRRKGANLFVVKADVSKQEQVMQVLKDIEKRYPPLRGVVHAAGVLDDGVLLQQTWERFEQVMAPKVQGAWNLHSLTRHMALDFFVLFSSSTSVFGVSGQGNHGAANAFLDGLAFYRKTQGLPALSINWGPWSDVGAAARSQVSERFKTKGVSHIPPSDGLNLLSYLFAVTDEAQVAVVPIHWPLFLEHHQVWPFFDDFRHTESKKPVNQPLNFLRQIQDTPVNKRLALLTGHVQSQVVKVLGLNPLKPIDKDQGFFELGMDSLTSVELRNNLQASLECPLPATLAFDYPTLQTMVQYLAHRVPALGGTSHKDKPVVKVAVEETGLEQLSEEEIGLLIDKELRH